MPFLSMVFTFYTTVWCYLISSGRTPLTRCAALQEPANLVRVATAIHARTFVVPIPTTVQYSVLAFTGSLTAVLTSRPMLNIYASYAAVRTSSEINSAVSLSEGTELRYRLSSPHLHNRRRMIALAIGFRRVFVYVVAPT